MQPNIENKPNSKVFVAHVANQTTHLNLSALLVQKLNESSLLNDANATEKQVSAIAVSQKPKAVLVLIVSTVAIRKPNACATRSVMLMEVIVLVVEKTTSCFSL
jgi:hypothetical protein